MTELICERCGTDVSQKMNSILYPHKFMDCCGREVEMKLCWDCDWDVSNGRDPFQDIGEVLNNRWEEDYAYDPINTPQPWWYRKQ